MLLSRSQDGAAIGGEMIGSIPFRVAVLLGDRAERREQAAAGDKQWVDRSNTYWRGDQQNRDPQRGQAQHRQGLARDRHATASVFCAFSLNKIIDGTDPEPASGEPGEPGPSQRDVLEYCSALIPIELQADRAASAEKIRVAAAQIVEAQIEQRRLKPFENGAADKTISGAVNDRNPATPVVGGLKRRVFGEVSLARQFELREYRPADNVHASSVGSCDKACEPFAAGKFVIIDHRKISCLREELARRGEGAIDRHTVAGPRFENAETQQRTALDELCRHGRTLTVGGVVLHDDTAEVELCPLLGQRLKRAPQ